VRAIARSNGKRIVGWQEMARAGCEPGDIAQIWMTPSVGGPGGFDVDDPVGVDLPPDIDEALAAGMELREIAAYDLIRALDQGASVLVSQQSKTYLDTKYAEASSNPAQADARRRLGMPYYAWSTVEDFYRWDPATLRAALKESRIAGVEAAIWSETIESLDDAFLMMLPRYPGVMEKAWSRPVESVPAWASYAPRLASHAAVWDRLGWPYFRSSVVWPDDV
ncbi:MAG TPA: family 20 glycosylhydrolase, partial [Thermomicrobiales bacterium]|nr:family 20 glycosylhydrolase [Thermomicrobiales bacterium]